MRTPSHVIAQDGTRLAYYAIPAKEGTKRPGIVFLGGFMSSMTGNKATALEAWAKKNGYAFLRYDYCGHGSSRGSIENGTISRWVEDSITIINFVRDKIEGLGGPLILVGSSMGAWIMIHVALAFESGVLTEVDLKNLLDDAAQLDMKEVQKNIAKKMLE